MTWVNGTMSGHIRILDILSSHIGKVSHTDLHNDTIEGEQLIGSHQDQPREFGVDKRRSEIKSSISKSTYFTYFKRTGQNTKMIT